MRVFEWNGPMLHAKTAVADGRWARVGSTNLNLASWFGNCELDVAVEDAGFAGQMEAMYRDDLGNATEIVLGLATGPCRAAVARAAARRVAAAPAGSPPARSASAARSAPRSPTGARWARRRPGSWPRRAACC